MSQSCRDTALNLENINLSYIAQNHSSVTILKHFVYRWQIDIIPEFLHDLEVRYTVVFYNINIKTSLTVHMIIQA